MGLVIRFGLAMKKVALFFIPLMLWWSCGEEPEDCAGVTGGSAEYDDCGVCNGDNSTCKDCNGDINGLAYENECGCVGGNTGYDPDFCCLDWELIPFETLNNLLHIIHFRFWVQEYDINEAK